MLVLTVMICSAVLSFDAAPPPLPAVPTPQCKAPAAPLMALVSDGIESGCTTGEKREGVWRHVDSQGRLVDSGSYVAGKKDGVWTGYNPDGTRSWTASWKAGVEDGVWRRYDLGKVQRELTYTDGKQTGKFLWFYGNGKKQTVENWVDGMREGLAQGFDEGGRLRFEAGYKAGKLHGWKRELCPNGKPFFKGRYDNGVLVEGGERPPPDKIPCSEWMPK